MAYEFIQIERRNKGVAWIIIDNPPVNTINEQLMDELEQTADELSEDSSVRVVVITSNHADIFLAGADLAGMNQDDGETSDGEDPIKTQSKRMQACFHQFALMPKPVIAAINGHALGGGCELALACDFRIMSAGRIGLTEVSLGIIPGAGGTQRMTQIVGRAKAIELIFKAKKLEREEALAIGLVNQITDNLEADTQTFAEQLSNGAVQAMGLAKQAINATDKTIDEGLEIEATAFANTFLTEEPGIGLAAFFMKEKPKFLTEK